jgi:hypothetical protein
MGRPPKTGWRDVISAFPPGKAFVALWDWEGGLVGRIILVLVVGVTLYVLYGLQAHKADSHNQTAVSNTAPTIQVNQSSNTGVNVNSAPVTQSVGPNNSGQVAQFNNSPNSTANFARSPWRISDEQKSRFATLLFNVPKGSIDVWKYVGYSPPQETFDEIVALLEGAGFTVPDRPTSIAWGRIHPGLLVFVRDVEHHPAFAQSVVNAFKTSGIKTTTLTNDMVQPNQLVVVVGTPP